MTREGKAVRLSAKEFQLLRYFVEHRGNNAVARNIAARSVGIRRDAFHAHG